MSQGFLGKLGATVIQEPPELGGRTGKHPSLELPDRRAKSDLKVFKGVQL